MNSNYKNLFHWNLQDGSTISAEAIIFLHDYIMFYLIIIIVFIMVILWNIIKLYTYKSNIVKKKTRPNIKYFVKGLKNLLKK